MARTSVRTPRRTASPAATPNPNKPAHTIRYKNLKAAIWMNDGKTGSFFTVTFSRSYQDDQKQWHDVTSFNAHDLPLLAKLSNDAHSWIEWKSPNRQKPATQA